MTDVVVVGGGIVGASAAYHLARGGLRPTLVDAGFEGPATPASVGLLAPGTMLALAPSVPAALLPLAFRSAAHYPALCERLAEDGEAETGYAVPGGLLVALDDGEASQLPALRLRVEERRRLGARSLGGADILGEVTLLDGAAARERVPVLASDLAGALFVAGTARLDGRLLRRALRRAAERHGLTVLNGRAELVRQDDRVLGVRVHGEVLAAEAVLVAGGAWSAALAPSLGLQLPVRPERGQSLHLEVPGAATDTWPAVSGFTPARFLVGFPGGRVIAGATRESADDLDARATAGGAHEVLREALRVAPGLESATLCEVRVGLRPLSADGLPILGRVPGLQNAYLAVGHGHLGLLLGPYTAALVADLLLGRPPGVDLLPFGPERFTQPAPT